MPDDEGTRRWQRVSWPTIDRDPVHLLRTAIADLRKAPRDDEARRRLRAIAADHGAWEPLAVLLADEARVAVQNRDVMIAVYEELADVHENLDHPIETVAAMEAVVALDPDNAAHHDRLAWLYRRAGAALKAAQAFEQVARLAKDDRARAALRAAGKLYRDSGRLDQAAAVYRQIVERKPSDGEAWRALEEILVELGRWHDVAAVRGALAERATGVDKAVLLRAQARAFEQAGEVGTAAALVATAARHAPDDVSGLVDYATVLAREGRAREAADVLAERIQQAVADGAPSANIAALRMRLVDMLEACGDSNAARGVLDKLLVATPDYPPARERLLEIARRHQQAGDVRAAVQTFSRAVELGIEDDQLARELDDARTELAVETAIADAPTGDSARAERTLRDILAARPLHEAANLALTDLLASTGRMHAAAAHVRATLGNAPDDAPPELVARLLHRCAKVTAALGDIDEAHQLLHEAHHLARRDLLITLSLGESCFARKLWREAAIHLGALADHPDAARHAARVALGLVRAGQAEVRALKPANAIKHYEAAVRLDPACAAAWHQLAQLATVGGDLERAAECFEREAAATTDPALRIRRYDALGDLALAALDDRGRAERAWQAIADSAPAPVLDKLLALLRARGATAERAAACERLSSLVDDTARARDLAIEAAEAYAAAGDVERSRALAERMVAAHPGDLAALACASSIVHALGDHDTLGTWLRPVLTARDVRRDREEADPRRAELWRKLGDAERARGSERPSLEAYQRAVACAPDSDGALAARRALIELASSFGRRADTSRLALVEAEQQPDEVIGSARALATSRKPDSALDARQLFELARALGVELVAEDEQFLDAHPLRAMASDEAYATQLGDAERAALIDDDDDGPLGPLLALVAEALPLVCPDAKAALDTCALSDATRLGAASDAAAAAVYPQIAKALGGPPTLLYGSPSRAHADLRVVLAAPPVIVLGPRFVQVRARSRSDAELDVDCELRFRLGRVVELARPHRAFATGVEPEVFDRFVAALVCAFAPGTGEAAAADVAREAERLHRALPVALRRRVAEYLASVARTSLDSARYRAACERAADRSGLVACGHPGYAVHLAGGPARARHLVELAASQRYLASQRTLRRR